MRIIVGEENLLQMTPTGRGQCKRIPRKAYDVVQSECQSYVSWLVVNNQFSIAKRLTNVPKQWN